jgi:dihydroxy-acid dehydratase
VQDSDLINIDIPGRRLDLLVADEELERRLSTWEPRLPDNTKGFLELYRHTVSQADQGAILMS